MDIDEIIEEFEFLDGWEERYRLIIDLGRHLEALPEDQHVAANKVRGCMSQVWLTSERDEADILHFRADSDAFIVKGLVAILLAMFNDKTPADVLAVDHEGLLAKLQLSEHLSMTRRNGLQAMVTRIRQTAAE